MAADWREESEANTCLKVFGQTLPLGSLLCLPLIKVLHSMTAVGYEVQEELMEKHSGIQHSVFLASQRVRRERYRELSADGQSPTRVRRKCQTDDKHLSVPSNVHLLHGLAVPAFHCLLAYSQLPILQYAPSFTHSLASKTLVFSGVARRRASHLVAIRPVNLRRYFSTPVRYVPVAKVNSQIGMESSDHKGFRENLHTARGSILPKKLAVSNLQPLMKPQERNKRRQKYEKKKTKDSRSTDLIQQELTSQLLNPQKTKVEHQKQIEYV